MNPLAFAYASARRAYTFAGGVRLPVSARGALIAARERLALPEPYPWEDQTEPCHWFTRGPQHGAADESGIRWIEGTESIMRRVGFADEIAKSEGSRSIDHTGWYDTDEEIDGIYVGAVYQVTGRGAPRYVAGYEHCDSGKSRSNMTGGACLDCSTFYDSKLDAAKAGDRLAEIESERDRDYQAASGAGFVCAELIWEIREIRRYALRLCAEVRAENRGPNGERMSADSATAEVLGRALFRAREEIEAKREQIASIAEESSYRHRDIFRESAGDAYEKICSII